MRFYNMNFDKRLHRPGQYSFLKSDDEDQERIKQDRKALGWREEDLSYLPDELLERMPLGDDCE